MPWISLCRADELPPEGEVAQFEVAGRILCVGTLNGAPFVLDDRCPHMGASLGQGTVEQGRVVCPWHGWEFDAHTGRCKGSFRESVRAYKVKVESGEVWIDL